MVFSHRFRALAVAIASLALGSILNSTPNASEIQAARERGLAYKKEIERDPATWLWNIPLELPYVTHGVIHSESMDRDIGYNIYLPPSYASDRSKRFPVVYYLHGATGSETSDTKVLDYVIPQIEDGTIGEVIYVFPNAGHFSGYRDRPDENVMAETYIVKELIPEIDSRFRTIATSSGRAIMGFSMGGGGAVRLALKHPKLFCGAASFGGAISYHPDSPDFNHSWNDPNDTPYRWASENKAEIKEQLALYFVVGGDDRMYPRHPPFLQHLDQLEIEFDYRVLGGVGHSIWTSMDRCGTDVVGFLASRYETAR